jgi:predicted Rossmann fold flavoprotein
LKKKITIIGGGAAGFFCAANLDENKFNVTILEQNQDVLQKVKISGGGRCNVSHACFDPRELVKFYPRGNKELLSVFSKFQPGDTMDWFAQRNVSLKIENDNRIFPESNSSQTIIDCF